MLLPLPPPPLLLAAERLVTVEQLTIVDVLNEGCWKYEGACSKEREERMR
jgi:hypothetical protein